MSRTLFEDVTQNLREQVLSGRYAPGMKLRETALAEDLHASRTVIRLALGALAQEGLVEGQPNRGFRVRGFTIDEVADAIEVRGTLEGMAARRVAERGLDATLDRHLGEILAQMDAALARGFVALAARSAWIELNAGLHEAVIGASGNAALADSISHLSRIPLVSFRAIVFDTGETGDAGWNRETLRAAHQDHHALVDALRARQGTRAEAIMREHALRSCRNKRQSLTAMKSVQQKPGLPGLALVSEGTRRG